MRYNPPSQWPLPPGFNPPPGWTPDPSWPPAPPGWQFWVDDAPPPGMPVAGQWPPQPGPYPGMPLTPPRSNKTRNILIAVGGAIVIAVVVVVVVLVAWPSSPPSDSDKIRGVVQAMQTAFNNGDDNGFESNVCDQEKLPAGNFDDSRQQLGTLTLKVTSVNVTGDSATASVTVKSSKKSDSNVTWKFVKDGGNWKMCGKSDDSSK